MAENLREKYKVNKTNIEQAYEYQIGLKNDPEYEKRVINTFLQIANLFKEKYPKISMEAPRGRKKSNLSIKTKIENLEIERLCKLYAIEGIDKEEKKELYELILKTTNNKEKDKIEEILFGPINNLNNINRIMKQEEIPEKTKTALLRIAKIKLQSEQSIDNEKLQEELDKNYGVKKVEQTKQYKDDLLKWKDIEQITPNTINKIHRPLEYLKIKDTWGVKLIIGEVPDDLDTNNEEIKKIIQERKLVEKILQERENSLDSTEINEEESELIKKLQKLKINYDDLSGLELAKEFAFELMNNKELLKKMNLKVLPEGYKHKEKQNGYRAEHIKFCYADKPEYTLELQLRSIYREDLSRVNGPAAHDKRSGKKRILPNAKTKREFIEQAREIIPEYILLKIRNGKFEPHKCSMAENMLEYYLGYVDLNQNEYKRVIQYAREKEQEQAEIS